MPATDTASSPKTKGPPPPPPSNADIAAEAADARASDARSRADFQEKTKVLYEAFRDPSVGMADYNASILAAHVFATADGEAMTRADAFAWAKDFRQFSPVAWYAVKTQTCMSFVAAMKRSNLESLSVAEYEAAASMIRG